LAFFTKEVKSVVHNLVKISLTLLKVTSVLEEIILFIIVFAISILSAILEILYLKNVPTIVLGRKFSLQNVMVYVKKEKLSQRLLKPELWKDVTFIH
jgi:hypothetical protein